jgi:cysteinyl-tRNA synthetase
MSLKLYSTLSRKLDTFEPVIPGQVKMYCCGITAYDYCHLGHARTCLVWDVTRRYLQWRGYNVIYVQNFTDIDDKILNRAKNEGTSMEAIAERFIDAYFEDMDRLNINRADAYPRATHSLDGIQQLITDLELKGLAYPAEGDVYYRVDKFEGYGKLSGRSLEDLQAGASGRVGETDKKENPFDFALWKGAKPDEPAWDSPWGKGRPGWHIECSAMVREQLGPTIDIHVGGSDLIFPHHENEIAQSEGVTGQALANYWLHNGMVKVEGEKMSKSLGNFITIRDLLDRYHPMAVRLFILQGHYRKPVDFTDDALQAATNGWETLSEGLLLGKKMGWGMVERDQSMLEKFQTIVDDDLNFTGGLAILFDLAKTLRKEGNILAHGGKTTSDRATLQQQWSTLKELADVLGFKVQLATNEEQTDGLTNEQIEVIITARREAKERKDYAESDRLRDELKAQGITLIDQGKGVTIWHRD